MKIGIIGGGQLGRMLALSAYPLGLTPVIYEQTADTCAAAVAAVVNGRFDDLQALTSFAAGVDVVTFDWENVPVSSVKPLARVTKVAPPANALARSQDRRHVHALLDNLSYVGVLAVEFFVHRGQLIANEMAPRVHNSGHWTIEGAVTSQFENHVRAIAGLPLGDTAVTGHSVMVNFIGAMPDRKQVLAVPGLHLHDYGKAPRAGRKLGHATGVYTTPGKRNSVRRSLLSLRRNVP